jgi:hypothetical protein
MHQSRCPCNRNRKEDLYFLVPLAFTLDRFAILRLQKSLHSLTWFQANKTFPVGLYFSVFHIPSHIPLFSAFIDLLIHKFILENARGTLWSSNSAAFVRFLVGAFPGRYVCISLFTIAVSRTSLTLVYGYVNFNFKGVLKIKLEFCSLAFYYMDLGVFSSVGVNVLSPYMSSLSKFLHKSNFPLLVISGEATTRQLQVLIL